MTHDQKVEAAKRIYEAAVLARREAPGTWVMSEAQSEAQSAAQEREDLAWKRYSDMKRKGKRVK